MAITSECKALCILFELYSLLTKLEYKLQEHQKSSFL